MISVVDLVVKISHSNDTPTEIRRKLFKDLNIKEEISTILDGLLASQIEFKLNGINYL